MAFPQIAAFKANVVDVRMRREERIRGLDTTAQGGTEKGLACTVTSVIWKRAVPGMGFIAISIGSKLNESIVKDRKQHTKDFTTTTTTPKRSASSTLHPAQR